MLSAALFLLLLWLISLLAVKGSFLPETLFIDLPFRLLMKYSFTSHRHHFMLVFCAIVTVLYVFKCMHPELDEELNANNRTIRHTAASKATDSIDIQAAYVDSLLLQKRPPLQLLCADGSAVRNRVRSVPRFETSFPDLNDVQLATARRIGITHIENRAEAQKRMDKLVFIGDNPFYSIEQLHQSIPYLIPRAATLLNEIGRAFNDSLVTKGFEPHKLIVTSVLRTREDVNRLRRVNKNASENSCHQHGTTFDISYNRFLQINADGSDSVRWVTAFKSILAEVLRDQREMGTCYVKYEVHQSCFHITAR